MKKIGKILILFIIILLLIITVKCYTGDTNKVSPVNQIKENEEVTNLNTSLPNDVIPSDVNVIIEKKDNWEANWEKNYKYEIIIENNSYISIKDWQLLIKNINSDLSINQEWNAKIDVLENDLVINCTDYNSKIEPNSQITLGFICSSKDNVNLEEYELYKDIDMKNELVCTNNINKMQEYKEDSKIEMQKNSPLFSHGKLTVKEGKVFDKNEKEFVIQGISTHSIHEFSQYINYETFRELKDNFNVNTIRLAMYTETELGYSHDLHTKIDEGIQYATELGLYVIIDWHTLKDNNPNINKDSAQNFFKEMAYKYKDYDNIIYEICNEPNGDVTWETVKQYALEIIEIIREFDKDGIIIIGTPDYCKNIEEAQKNPIDQYDNLLYSFHFYAGTHKKDLREKLEKVLNKNFPVIVSEFGISEASGTGNVDETEANIWINFLREKKVGYICWNLSNKDESSSILKAGVENITSWNEEELSKTGLWLKKVYKEF